MRVDSCAFDPAIDPAWIATERVANVLVDLRIMMPLSQAALVCPPRPLFPSSSSLFLARSSSTGLLGAYNEWRRHTTSKLDAEPDAYSGSDGVTLLMGRRNMHLDAEKRIIHFADGTSVT